MHTLNLALHNSILIVNFDENAHIYSIYLLIVGSKRKPSCIAFEQLTQEAQNYVENQILNYLHELELVS